MSGLDTSRSSQGRGLCGLLDLLLDSISTLHSQFVFDPLITVLRSCDTYENHGHFPYSFGLNVLLDYRIQCHVLPLHPLVCAFEASYFASRSSSLVVVFIACFHPRPCSASPVVGVLTFHEVSAAYCGIRRFEIQCVIGTGKTTMSLSRTIISGSPVIHRTGLAPIPDIEIEKKSCLAAAFLNVALEFFMSSANGGPERTPKTLVVNQL